MTRSMSKKKADDPLQKATQKLNLLQRIILSKILQTAPLFFLKMIRHKNKPNRSYVFKF